MVASSQEEADRLALPQLQAMVALRTGQPLQPQRLVEEAEKETVPDAHQGLLESMSRRWVIGTPASAAAEIRVLASTYDVDEVMVHPVAGAFVGTAATSSPAREETLVVAGRGSVAGRPDSPSEWTRPEARTRVRSLGTIRLGWSAGSAAPRPRRTP